MTRFIVAAWAALLVSACQEDTLAESLPRITVCLAPDAVEAECNRAFELGDRPMTLSATLTLYVVNRGERALSITSATSSDAQLTVTSFPASVEVSQGMPLVLTITPAALGASSANVEIASNDTQHSPLTVRVQWQGTPKPIPILDLCVEGVGAACGIDLQLDFGAVRRTQLESRTIRVRNVGTALLTINQVSMEGASTVDGEISVATSTRPGFLPPNSSAPLVILYQPRDGQADQVVLAFDSDDPANPQARITVKGTSAENQPPTADARQAGSGGTQVDVVVGDVVGLDGAASLDPEGDPLIFEWTLVAPAGSQSTLDDPSAGRVTFVPDRTGRYRAELTVTDSLGQQSAPAAVVLLNAHPRYAMRATLDWQNGGDVDLHLVPEGQALFGDQDCYFANPRPLLGNPLTTLDDPSLSLDSRASPGHEEAVYANPPDGTYALYAQYFEELTSGPATVTAQVIFNDSGVIALQQSLALPQQCAVWHIADIVFPSATLTPANAALALQCR